MGKETHKRQVEKLFDKSFVVDTNSVKRIVEKTHKVKQYTKQLLRNMVKQGKIKRLTKGYYTSHDDPSLAVFCFKPAYLGLQDALSFHDLWEQEIVPVIITTRKIRPGVRAVLGTNVLIRRIEKRYCFGFEYSKQGEFYLPYSDLEKTFIDMVYFNERMTEETVKNLRCRIDKKKLDSYLKTYPKRFIKKIKSIIP
ncbi:hypothetical protein FJZ53_03805 [Candidatus Woesearchaeota archaeon]|nr:hypothetical protein [Candidatus Woesearchaeota archaeon]